MHTQYKNNSPRTNFRPCALILAVLSSPFTDFCVIKTMRRLTAIVLLFLALTGTFVPVAAAVTAPAQHACCIRHAHNCHNSAASSSDEFTIRSAGCCDHDCCRAVTASQKAHPRPTLAVTFAQQVHAPLVELRPTASAAESTTSQSPRAPPGISLA
jgi:hypothetical protein